MKDREDRLLAIEKLIKSKKIQSQDELLNLLVADDFEVTQATLSRDLRFLKVSKVLDESGAYIYAFPQDDKTAESKKIYVQDFLRGYLSIDVSGNIVVIKTVAGHANSVCNAIDFLDLPEILGTVAGDNCMFACLREGVSKKEFFDSLKQKIPGLST